jgi:hypothetical protein
MKHILIKQTTSSQELLQINLFREQEGNRTELRHETLNILQMNLRGNRSPKNLRVSIFILKKWSKLPTNVRFDDFTSQTSFTRESKFVRNLLSYFEVL